MFTQVDGLVGVHALPLACLLFLIESVCETDRGVNRYYFGNNSHNNKVIP